MGEALKKNSDIKKQTQSLDWNELVTILDDIVIQKTYNEELNEKWSIFRQRIHEKQKLSDLTLDLQKQIIQFIENMYSKNIFIMKNGELEDYYKRENFKDELSNLSGKGIIAYKISELSQNDTIENYIEISEYKEILQRILGEIPKSISEECE